MLVSKLEHYNVRTRDLAGTVEFYTDILGLRSGERPPTQIPGAWMYNDEGTPVIHLVEIDPNKPNFIKEVNDYLGYRDIETLAGSGAIDHIAFQGHAYDQILANIRKKGLECKERVVPGGQLRQIFVSDPNGINIELNFYAGA